jgi:serine/threonine-protein kinase
VRCPSCEAGLAVPSRFCPECGAAIARDGDAATFTIAKPRAKPPSSSSASEEVRFTAGTILADRYRVLGLVGRGGMGEVYRATDLKLNQPVALKFLPESTAHNPRLLERFHGEVRIARQVSHPNVCRVYDIAEVDGAACISMEYVDGEDLGGLLRRIGRLPGDKAVEIARKLCAGLAAAHAKGVLHRDLKPSNIMIDGRGQVLIMDFGLAAIADQVEGAEVRSGTPAYMAPEQLAGREVTERSDIYALGLVLYEIFTGQRAFLTADRKVTPSAARAVKDIDPVIERAITRCLEPDAAKRPQSALALARMLPGGDPLAEALAAGETPSPEMVAASGETEGLRPVVAWVLLAGVIVLVIAGILLGAQAKLYRRVPLEKPPEALAERAREILRSVGYSEQPVDTAMGFYEGTEFLRYLDEHDKSKTRWDNLETGPFVFWYRGSPRPLVSNSSSPVEPIMGSVWTDDPPLDVSGMRLVQLNPLGRLTQFIAVPPQVEDPGGAASSPEWAPLFSAAGLDPSKWPAAQPAWTPPVYSDARAAWTGSLAERPDIPMRIEAAAYRGKPVYFELIGPWTRPERMLPYQLTAGERAGFVLLMVLLLTVMVGSAMLTRRNLRLGRGDRRGASRLAVFVFAVWSVAWSCGAHHVPVSFEEFRLFITFLSFALLFSCSTWLLYIALEPYVRRRWPATLVSWSRLLAGGFRDPLVGRDLLVGCLLGAFSIALVRLGWFVPTWLGHPPTMPYPGPQWQFTGSRAIIADISNSLILSLFASLGLLFFLFLLRALLRKEWAAALVCVLLFTTLRPPSASQYAPVVLVTGLITTGLQVFLLIRFGLLAVMASSVFNFILGGFPLTTQGSAWYAGISLAGILLMAAMAFYGFHTSLGDRPVFGGAVLEE